MCSKIAPFKLTASASYSLTNHQNIPHSTQQWLVPTKSLTSLSVCWNLSCHALLIIHVHSFISKIKFQTAAFGRKEIELAENEMPGLIYLREKVCAIITTFNF